METIEKISAERCMKMEISNTIDWSRVYEDNHEHGLKNRVLFFSRFGIMPNLIELWNIDLTKARKYFQKTYHAEITDCKYSKSINRNGKLAFYEISYLLFDDLLVCFYSGCIDFYYRKTNSELVEKMARDLRKFRNKVKSNRIKLLVNEGGGLDTKTLSITKPKLTIEDNYNEDFLPIHKTILSRLQKKNDKGLVLLHGKPGTGKTSYIRYLISSLKKNVIFLPPNMAGSITDPGLMSVMIENPNSVFVIEDAENIIIDRNRNGSSSVSALLNLADGLLSDCLNIQIICSFNTDLSRVDSALMRKGRLIAKYEFNELETDKAQALSDKLGFSTQITEPMTLASVYNQDDAEFAPTIHRKAIGFY